MQPECQGQVFVFGLAMELCFLLVNLISYSRCACLSGVVWDGQCSHPNGQIHTAKT